MTEQQYLNLALAKMHSGQWFGWKKIGLAHIEKVTKTL